MEDYKCETIKMINWRESLAQSSKKGRLIQYLEGQIVLVAINIGLDFVKKNQVKWSARNVMKVLFYNKFQLSRKVLQVNHLIKNAIKDN